MDVHHPPSSCSAGKVYQVCSGTPIVWKRLFWTTDTLTGAHTLEKKKPVFDSLHFRLYSFFNAQVELRPFVFVPGTFLSQKLKTVTFE